MSNLISSSRDASTHISSLHKAFCDSDTTSAAKAVSVKWGKKFFTIELSLADWETYSLNDLKGLLAEETSVRTERQKLLGISTTSGNPNDSTLLSELRFAKNSEILLIGTPDHEVFKDASKRDDLPEIWDDFDYSGNESSLRIDPIHVRRLQVAIQSTSIHLITPIKANKPLLVLDLDYTCIDCKGRDARIDELKRPFLDEFMETVGRLYNIVIWSQTSWKWVEMKCTALGFFTNHSIAFVLDKSSMFTVCSRQSDGTQRRHLVKALEVIWSKFSLWNSTNTIHVDDLSRNFAFNPSNGLKINAYRRTKRETDIELFSLAPYLSWLSTIPNFTLVDHKHWRKRVERGQLTAGKLD